MSYSRRVPKRDIRSYAPLLTADTQNPNTPLAPLATPEKLTTTHKPGQEVRAILLYTIPLIIALVAGTYLDHQKQWVIPFAESLFKLGS